MAPSLADDLFRDQVLRARNTPPGEKLSAGFRLFMQAQETMRAGIRMTLGLDDPEAIEREVERRLRIAHALEAA